MTFSGGRDDMQRVRGLRIEEESRRREQETQARLAHGQRLETTPQPSWLGDFVARVRRAVRR